MVFEEATSGIAGAAEESLRAGRLRVLRDEVGILNSRFSSRFSLWVPFLGREGNNIGCYLASTKVRVVSYWWVVVTMSWQWVVGN